MASENETVMAVCAEWRACIEAADPSVWNDERIAGLVKTTKEQQLAYLDRIEAARERERTEIEANALAIGGIVEASRHTPGNAAAMREALETIHDKVNGLDEECGVDPVEIRDIARAALAAPARNCDRFADETDAQIAFLNEVWLISVDRETMLALDKYENWSDGMRTRYGRWLLAPAAERKGEGDGK